MTRLPDCCATCVDCQHTRVCTDGHWAPLGCTCGVAICGLCATDGCPGCGVRVDPDAAFSAWVGAGWSA